MTAGREAPVLEAVGVSQDWHNAEEQTLSPKHHRLTANGNGSAGSSGHIVKSPRQQSAQTADAPHDVTASSAASADGGDASVQPVQGLGEVVGTEDAASVSRAADVAVGATEGTVTITTEGTAEASAASGEVFRGLGELADIDELRGVRVSVDGNGKAIVEYLVHWKVCIQPRNHDSSSCSGAWQGSFACTMVFVPMRYNGADMLN